MVQPHHQSLGFVVCIETMLPLYCHSLCLRIFGKVCLMVALCKVWFTIAILMILHLQVTDSCGCLWIPQPGVQVIELDSRTSSLTVWRDSLSFFPLTSVQLCSLPDCGLTTWCVIW